MGVNKITSVTASTGNYELISLYGDEIQHSLPDNYTDDSVTSTDYAHDHHPKSGSSEWRNQITTGLKNKYYYVMNKILSVFSEPKTENKEIDPETGEINITYSGNDLPTSLTEPSDNANVFDQQYNNYWSVFEQFKEDNYLGSVPDLYAPYATFKENQETYLAGSGNDIINSQYTLWNNQHKLLQHIVCKNLMSYANGGYLNGNYTKERCSYGDKTNGTKGNGTKSNGSQSNGTKGNGGNNKTISSGQGWVYQDAQYLNGSHSHGTNSKNSHSNGDKTNGLHNNIHVIEVAELGTCGAQGARTVNILCQKKSCSQTCPNTGNNYKNYDEVEILAFISDTATSYINY